MKQKQTNFAMETTRNIMPWPVQILIQEFAKPIGLRLDWRSGAPHAEPLNTYTENVDRLYKQPKYMTPSLRQQFSKSVIAMKVSHKNTNKWYRQWFQNRKGQWRGNCRRKKRALPSSQRKFVPVLREPKKETMKIDGIFSSLRDERYNIYRGEREIQSTLTRFYSLHTFVLPWSLAVFMLMHFLMIRKQGISGPL